MTWLFCADLQPASHPLVLLLTSVGQSGPPVSVMDLDEVFPAVGGLRHWGAGPGTLAMDYVNSPGSRSSSPKPPFFHGGRKQGFRGHWFI